jgi:hypothetical protein
MSNQGSARRRPRKSKTMKKASEYLNQDGQLILNLAIYNRFSNIGDEVYSEICGGFIEGVYQWSTHNIDEINEVTNDNFTGWVISFNGGQIRRRIYIENRILDYISNKCKGWGHAKNVFLKHVKTAN